MIRRRNLLIVTEEFTSGGLETHVRGEIQSLSSLGVTCHLACGGQANKAMCPPLLSSVSSGLALGPHASAADLLATIDALSDVIRRNEIHFIHLHGFTSLIAGSIVAELHCLPSLITIHGPALLGSAYGPMFDYLLDAIVLPGASRVVTVSEELRAQYLPYVESGNLLVIPNAVPVPSADAKVAGGKREGWLYASRLDRAKLAGLRCLLSVAEEDARVQLDIAGDGPETDTVERLVRDLGLGGRVALLGSIDDLPSVMPRYEVVFGMGRVVLEAVAAGVPACLVGYDGIKGVVTADLLERAAWANFSGRNLPNVDAGLLPEQLRMRSAGCGDDLRRRVERDFAEPSVWHRFNQILDDAGPRQEGFLTRLLTALRLRTRELNAEGLPYLSSPIFRTAVGRLSAAPGFRNHGLASSFSYHIGLSEAAPIGNSSLGLLAAQWATQQELIRELDASVLQKDLARKEAALQLEEAALQLEVETAKVATITKEVSRLEGECRRLADVVHQTRTEAVKVSDWAASIDRSPILYASKKHALAFSRRVLRWLPLNREVRSGLRLFVSRARYSPGAGSGKQRQIKPQRLSLLSKKTGCALQPGRRDVFIFGVIDWHFRFQRPQQLSLGLAHTGKRVFYISNEFVDSPEPGYDIEWLDDGLYQVRLRVRSAPAIYGSLPSLDVQQMILLGLGELMLEQCVSGLYGVVHHPFWRQTVWSVPNCIRVYDCMDHHEGFGGVKSDLVEAEECLLTQADQVIVTSAWLDKFARQYTERVTIIRNAGDFEFFSQAPKARYIDQRGRRIVGYYGAIAEWFDTDLLAYLAGRNPDVLFLLVGRDTADAEKKLSPYPNVRLVGEVPYQDLPYYLYSFDVCVLPFRVLPLTLATNPVKVYEYLSAGRPVVATELPEMRQFDGFVRTAREHEDFHCQVASALEEGERQELVEARRAFAQGQTWNHRGQDLVKCLEAVALPRISVIVLTYNNLALSQACLNSLLQRTDYPNLEVIVVDNASTDETPEFLLSVAAGDVRVKVLLNEVNLGFAAGNNIGLAEATGDYLVLLNNDTAVTDGWLMTLMRYLQDNAGVGLVGPVTNNIGNEARIDLNYGELNEMFDVARTYTLANIGVTRALSNIAFFCVAMRRSTYDTCGPLCEDYGIGFFEDDDYCRRVEQAGLEVVCVEDVFVHHHLSASFSKLGSAEKAALFDRNKAIYEDKWGPWAPHEYR